MSKNIVNLDWMVEKSLVKKGFTVRSILKDEAKVYVVAPILLLQLDDHKHGDLVSPDPCMTLSNDSAITLMTELWNAGVRPVGYGEDKSTKNPLDVPELMAVKNHLDDMRKVAFELLGLKK